MVVLFKDLFVFIYVKFFKHLNTAFQNFLNIVAFANKCLLQESVGIYLHSLKRTVAMLKKLSQIALIFELINNTEINGTMSTLLIRTLRPEGYE